jgi:hypothetical protein
MQMTVDNGTNDRTKEEKEEKRVRIEAQLADAKKEALEKAAKGTPLQVDPRFASLVLERKPSEVGDENFPPHLHAACELFVMTGNLGQAVRCKKAVDTFLYLMASDTDGSTAYDIGRACCCWQCGHVGIPANIEECAFGLKVNGICSQCASDEQTNFVIVKQPDGSVIPWVRFKHAASPEAIKAAAEQEKREMVQKVGGKKTKPNAKCPCGSRQKFKKCCGGVQTKKPAAKIVAEVVD